MYEHQPNTGTLFESKPGAKTDFHGAVVVKEPGTYVMFGRKKSANRRSDGKPFNFIEISLMKENSQQPQNMPLNTTGVGVKELTLEQIGELKTDNNKENDLPF